MGRPKQIHCQRGHLFEKGNEVWNKRGRSCRICHNANAKIRYNEDPRIRDRLVAQNKVRKAARHAPA